MSRPVLAVFGGSFNPPHIGHALVPGYLLARGHADRVLVAPCYEHALGKSLTPFDLRFSMVRGAMRAYGSAVEVSAIESELALRSGRPSYTIELLEAVAAAWPEHSVRLVVGSDILVTGETERWHRWDRIEAEFNPVVIPRSGYADREDAVLPEVSSTEVRRLVGELSGKGRSEAERRLAHLLPAVVLDHLLRGSRGRLLLLGRGHVAHHARMWLTDQGFEVTVLSARGLVDDPTILNSCSPGWRGAWILSTDPSIETVAGALVDAGWARDSPVLHAAGSLPSAKALAPIVTAGGSAGTLHPICSLRRERSRSWLHEAGFGIEGGETARQLALEMVGSQPHLDLEGFDEVRRQAYHAACALVANHLAVLWHAGCEVLITQGHAEADARDVLATLLRSSLDNLLDLGIPAGVTGPVSRGNLAAVQAHVNALEGDPAELYAELSRRLQALLNR